MWLIVQNDLRAGDGAAVAAVPTRKMVAACRTEAAAGRWLGRLEQSASDDAGRPAYEVLCVTGLRELNASDYVGPQYYSTHGRRASLRQMVADVRKSHAALRQEYRGG